MEKGVKALYFMSMLLLTVLAGCSADQREVKRQSSPNNKLIAVLMESAGRGDSDPLRQNLYLNDAGLPLSLDKPVFSAEGCDRLSFEWVNDYTVQIHYETTCAISHFTNRWYRPSDLAVGKPVPIEIVLIRG
jgi:hypothetical protein